MATKECPVSEKFKQMLVDANPIDPNIRDRCLAPPNPKEYEKVMQKREKVSTHEWLQDLEMVLLKASDDERKERSKMDDIDMSDEIVRFAGGSLAVATIDKILSVKELIEGIMNNAEDIIKSGRFPRVV